MDGDGQRAGRVLVVDDEPYITDAVATALRYEGYETREAGDAAQAARRVRDFDPDLVVLDVGLPGMDGLRLAARLREDGRDLPVIFLTARDGTEDRLAGLAVGDDYVTKPFALEEVVARVGNVLRRARPARAPGLRFADLVLDPVSREAARAGVPLPLTRTEFDLLHHLMRNPRRVLTRQQILDAVWEPGFTGDPSVVETYVSYLRRKLGTGRPQLIHTVRAVGYVLREPGDR